MQHYTSWVWDSAGNGLPSITVDVYGPNTTSHATIYSDNGITTISNPVSTDSLGKFTFYAANGAYDLLIDNGGAGEETIEDVILFDPFDAKATDTDVEILNAAVTGELLIPTTVPASPTTGNIWETAGLLKHGASSKALVETTTAQTLTNKTFSDQIISSVSTGTPPFSVASTTAVTNLRAATASALASGASVTLAQLPFGSANQILGTNSGATAIEHKTLAVDGTGTDFGITHTANTITLNLPSASAANRGLITAGGQTIAGAKNFTGAMTAGAGLAVTGAATVSTTLGVTGATTLSSTLLYKQLTEIVTATNVIAAAESGSVFFLSSVTEFASTLPALAAGLHFKFIVSAAPSGASYTVTTGGPTTIKGHVISSQDAGGSADSGTAGEATVTFADGKAVAGDCADFYCDGTNWFVDARCKVFDGITIS